MQWIAEYTDGKTTRESDGSIFYEIEYDKLKSFYFEDNGNRYGFNCDSGYFFVNNQEFDFDNRVGDGPFGKSRNTLTQYKTGIATMSGVTSIVSWSIGYIDIFDGGYVNSLLTITKTKEIYFSAEMINLKTGEKKSNSIKVL